MPIKYFLQISFFILLTLNTDAQNRQLQLISIDSDSTTLAQIASLPNVCKNQSECQNLLENYIKTLRKKAYITASLDSIYADTLQTKAYVFLGKKYEWLQLEKGNISEKILNQVGFRPQKFYQKAFNWEPSDYPNALKFGNETVSIPISPKLSDNELDKIISVTKNILSEIILLNKS